VALDERFLRCRGCFAALLKAVGNVPVFDALGLSGSGHLGPVAGTYSVNGARIRPTQPRKTIGSNYLVARGLAEDLALLSQYPCFLLVPRMRDTSVTPASCPTRRQAENDPKMIRSKTDHLAEARRRRWAKRLAARSAGGPDALIRDLLEFGPMVGQHRRRAVVVQTCWQHQSRHRVPDVL
jgi:hypothetical protein